MNQHTIKRSFDEGTGGRLNVSTFYSLLAEFGSTDIELARVCGKYFGLTESEAKKRACMNRLPVPAYHAGSQKSPWLVSAAELASHIDTARELAAREWQKSQAA